MKKWEKEILQKQIKSEQAVIYRLRDSYKFALEAVNEKIQVLMAKDQTQSVIYQLRYQQNLQRQLESIYSQMSQNWYSDIDSYLKDCYEDSFYSTMYGIQQDGIPAVIPFNQKEMAQMAAQSDFYGIQLSQRLYNDSVEAARVTRQEITRGIAMNSSYADITRAVAKRGEPTLNQAFRIVRTESHRIHEEVKFQTIDKVKNETGADIVKQWDSSIDKRTRPSHAALDGQLREIEQPFKCPLNGHTAMYPGGFGIASEDINCRCVMLQRARWALDQSELEKAVGDLDGMSDDELEELAKKFGISKEELINKSNGVIESDGSINHRIRASNYNQFKKKYQTKAAQKAAQAQVGASSGGVFDADAYGQRRTNAWRQRFRTKEEADKYYRAQLDSNWGNYSDREKYSIWEYTHNSNPMNKSLSGYHDTWNRSNFLGIGNTDWGHEDGWRFLNSDDFISRFAKNSAGNVDYRRTISDLTTAIDKSVIDKDTYLVRGTDNGGLAGLLESIMPFDDAKSYIDDGDIASLKALVEGNTVTNHAFTSTGVASGTGFSGTVNYKIYAPKGTRGIYAEPQSYYGSTISGEEIYKAGQSAYGVGSEAEVILQRGTSFRVTKIDYSKGQYTVEMEVVDQPNYFKHGDENTFDGGATRHKS